MSNNYPNLRCGCFYHIYNRGNNSENIFLNADNFNYFLTLYDKYICPIADTYAWCLMPNHFHFLIRVKEEEEVRRVLHLSGLEDPKGELTTKNL